MKITKFGHSCLLVEEGPPAGGARILIDPGKYSTLQNVVSNIDAIVITHEHDDHCDVESVKTIIKNNPQAVVITNSEVGKKLAEEPIAFHPVEDGQNMTVKGVLIEGFGTKHAIIYPSIPRLVNTGYRIAKRFFYGGDSVENIVPCEILAYPAIAPWMKSSEAVDYAKTVKPKICFPVHDAFLKTITGGFYNLPKNQLEAEGIRWVVIEEGKSIEA
jgi:L-ascorbate metabolism protein UlaG (beta-lactamase superfamily)